MFKNKAKLMTTLFVFGAGLLGSASLQARNIYLNGNDISGARSVDMKNVTIHINEQGDLMITAPHYQVIEENSYMPLSRYVEGVNKPEHQARKALPPGLSKVADASKIKPLPKANDQATLAPKQSDGPAKVQAKSEAEKPETEKSE